MQPPDPTFADKYFIFGVHSTFPSLIFIGCLIISVFIHFLQLDLKHRLGFFAFSFIPLIVGIAVFAHEFSDSLTQGAHYANIYDLRGLSLDSAIYFNILVLSSIQTAVLLFIAGLLLMGKTPPAPPEENKTVP